MNSATRPDPLRLVLIKAFLIALVGVILGLSFNYTLVMNIFTGKGMTPAAPPKQSVQLFPLPVGLEMVRQMTADGALLIDARTPETFAVAHIPGAHPLPMVELEERLPLFKEEVPLDALLILYCSGYGCPDSFDLGMRLIEEGYRNVHVFEGGVPEWEAAGLPMEGEAQ